MATLLLPKAPRNNLDVILGYDPKWRLRIKELQRRYSGRMISRMIRSVSDRILMIF
jgi:hypothetical protein